MKNARKVARSHSASAPCFPFGLPLDTEPMEARTAESLPNEPGRWQFEPKWDGFRCLAFKGGGAVELRGKSGKPLGRYFPEVVATVRELPFERFIVDGELVVELNGRLSFDALQMRLHPAESRIRKLSTETPARLVLFDMLLAPDGANLTFLPLADRRGALEIFGRRAAISSMTPETAWSPSGSTAPMTAASERCSRSNGCAPRIVSLAAFVMRAAAGWWVRFCSASFGRTESSIMSASQLRSPTENATS